MQNPASRHRQSQQVQRRGTRERAGAERSHHRVGRRRRGGACAPVCSEETCLSRCGDLALCWRTLGAAEGWVIFDTKRAGVGMGTGLYYQHKGCLSCTRVFLPILRLLGIRVPGTSKEADQVVCLLYAAARLEEFASGHLANRS